MGLVFFHSFFAIARAVGEAHLHGPVSLGYIGAGFIPHLVVPHRMQRRGVDRYGFSDGSAEQLVDRLTSGDSLQIPESDVDRADDLEDSTFPAIGKRRPEETVPETFDIKRILIDQQPGEMVFDDGAYRLAAVLAPAGTDEPIIGFDLDDGHP